jgi:hypothetical protein
MDIEFIRERVSLADADARSAFLEAGFGGSAEDDSVEAIIDEPEPFAIAFDMTYAGSGGTTRRRVRLNTIKDVGTDINFSAWCYVRENYRTFKLSKVIEIYDIATGDTYLRPRDYFEELGILATLTEEAKAISECFNELTVLAFLGACDGQFLPEEKDELVKHVCLKADIALDQDAVRRRVTAFAPDEKAFLKAMRNLETDEEGHRALVRSIRRVIEADGLAHQNEIVIGAKLLKSLGVMV